MRKVMLLAMLAATAALSFVGPKPKTTLLFSLKGHGVNGLAVSGDGRRLYWQDSTQLYVYDRATRRSSRVLDDVKAARIGLAVSPAGDRLAFTRTAEGGGDQQLWTVPLDPTSGLAAGTPRRGSILVANAPTFSPDGKSIAFATPTSRTAKNLVVIPANGGPERIIARTEGDIWPITWPKTDSLYFGVSFEKNGPRSGLYRTSATGGEPELVRRTAAWGAYPGLSPDGRFIVVNDSTWDSLVVATSSGKRLHAYFDEPAEPTADVWSTAGKGIGAAWRTMRVVNVVDLAGRERSVGDTALFNMVLWSPDGRRVATLNLAARAIVITDVSAGTRRVIPVEHLPEGFTMLLWSPDGRFIAYRDRPGAIQLLDPATSKGRQLAATSSLDPLAKWRSDSRALLYAVEHPAQSTDAKRKIDIHEVTIAGQDRMLHSIEARCSGGAWCGRIIDDSLLSTWEVNGEYRVTNFRARGAPRVVYTRDGKTAPQVPPVPTFSANGQWMGVRHQSASDQRWSIEMMHPDGSAHRSVPLPFRASHGGRNPWIRDDGAELIVASPDCAERPNNPCPDGVTFYRVEVASGRTTPVASIPSVRSPDPVLISDDGRSLAYLHDVETRTDVYEVDFTELFAASGTRTAVRP
jgi:Tol biopolymer transport system component